MEPIKVKLDQLYVDEEGKKIFPKDRYENVQELVNSIQLNGLYLPLTVTQQPDSRYKIISGMRRYYAIKKLSPDHDLFMTGIPVNVVDSETAPLAGILESQPRQESSALDICKSAKACIDSGITVAELAKKCGVTVRWVQMRISVATMFEQLEARLKDFNPHLIQELKKRAGQNRNDSYEYIAFTHLYYLCQGLENYKMDAMTTGHISNILEEFLRNPAGFIESFRFTK